MEGQKLEGPIVVFDDDGYYMGSVIAELLVRQGHAVTYVTTAGIVSEWSGNTAEQSLVQARLIELGVAIIVSHAVAAADGNEAVLTWFIPGANAVCPAAASSASPRANRKMPFGLNSRGVTMALQASSASATARRPALSPWPCMMAILRVGCWVKTPD